MLTLDQLQKKLPVLQQERDHRIADANAAVGMVVLCESLIAEWLIPEVPSDDPKSTS